MLVVCGVMYKVLSKLEGDRLKVAAGLLSRRQMPSTFKTIQKTNSKNKKVSTASNAKYFQNCADGKDIELYYEFQRR